MVTASGDTCRDEEQDARHFSACAPHAPANTLDAQDSGARAEHAASARNPVAPMRFNRRSGMMGAVMSVNLASDGLRDGWRLP